MAVRTKGVAVAAYGPEPVAVTGSAAPPSLAVVREAIGGRSATECDMSADGCTALDVTIDFVGRDPLLCAPPFIAEE